MAPRPFTFGLDSRPGRFGPDGGGRLINAFFEEAADTAKWPFTLHCIEGLDSFASLSGSGGCRGMQDLGAAGYAIRGPVVSKIDGNGTASVIGGFPGSAPVFTARNAKTSTPQIMLVSEGLRAILEDDNLIEITDADLPAPVSVFHQGGYFIAVIADGRFFISALNDGLSWNALDFATAEANHDGALAGIDRGQEAIVAGERSIEFWANTGNADFPFEKVQGSTLNLGILAGHTLKKINGIPLFAASDYTVRMLNGYEPIRVSTHDVERDLRALANPISLVATAYSLDGHNFYNLSSDEWTWTFDATYQRWHERASRGLNRWVGQHFMDLGGRKLVGDASNGSVYQINPDANSEAGSAIVWRLISGPVGAWPNPVIINSLYVDLVPGVGQATGASAQTDPLAMLRASRNDGKTWGNSRTARTGKIGEYGTRTRWHRLGLSGENGFRFEVSMSAQVARAMMGAALDAEAARA